MTEGDHAACVTAWLESAPLDLPAERRLLLFERAFGALWRRASRTLGEITLTAITGRVLHDAGGRFPVLAAIEIDAGGIRWEEVRARAGELDGEELREATRVVLVQFLTVLGNLTAEILTPALHAELSGVVVGDGRGDERAAPADEDDEGAAP